MAFILFVHKPICIYITKFRRDHINQSTILPHPFLLNMDYKNYKESKHLFGILFRQRWLLAAKVIRNQHIY